MQQRTLLIPLAALTFSALLASCGQSAPAANPTAANPPASSTFDLSTPDSSTPDSSETKLTSSALTLNPTLLFQTRWFSGKVTSYSCTAPWWNQAQMNAELLAQPRYLRIQVSNASLFLNGSRTLTARFHFVSGPPEVLTFSGTQLQNTLQVDGSLSTQQGGPPMDVGTAFVLDYDTLSKGTAFRGVLSVKAACGSPNIAGPTTTYPGVITFHTDRV